MTPAGAPPAEGTLLFVYAADSGLFNTAMDIAHKLISPHTYPCRLCALTHGHFKVKQAWQRFVEELPVPCEFLHRDEALSLPGIDPAALPTVYRRKAGRWQCCLDREAIANYQDLDQLMAAIRNSCTAVQA